MRKKLYWILLFVGVFIQVGLPEQSRATQVRAVETEGSIGFTGEVTPVNEPEESNPSFKLVLSFAPDVEED